MPRTKKKKTFTRIMHDDAAVALDRVKNGTVDLIVTSPPYNIRKEYEKNDAMALEEYRNYHEQIIVKLSRKIKEAGSVCWQVGNYVRNGEVIPLDFLFFELFHSHGFKLRNRIIWQFNFGLHAKRRFSGRYETLLWFTKGDDFKFNLDAVRVPQKYPGKRHPKARGQNGGEPSGNKLGKNPSDYWEFSAKKFFAEDLVWQFPNVKANHPEKTIHPCQFPSELAERCILAFTDEADVILDPFLGSGTSVIAATKYGRSAIGIDRDTKYIKLARQRLKEFKRGNLNLRPIGKPIASPRTAGKVSEIPREWLVDVA